MRSSGIGLDAVLRSTRPRGCVTLYLDGHRVAPDDVNVVSPSALYGVEIYSGAVAPSQYKGFGNCEIVLIWTK